MSSAAELPPADYEPRDALPKPILFVGAGLALGIAASLGIGAMLMNSSDRLPAPRGTIGRQTSFQFSPEAKTDIAADWTRADRQTKQNLDSYGWIDRAHGVVRIPIDRAIDLLAADAAEKPSSKGAAK